MKLPLRLSARVLTVTLFALLALVLPSLLLVGPESSSGAPASSPVALSRDSAFPSEGHDLSSGSLLTFAAAGQGLVALATDLPSGFTEIAGDSQREAGSPIAYVQRFVRGAQGTADLASIKVLTIDVPYDRAEALSTNEGATEVTVGGHEAVVYSTVPNNAAAGVTVLLRPLGEYRTAMLLGRGSVTLAELLSVASSLREEATQ